MKKQRLSDVRSPPDLAEWNFEDANSLPDNQLAICLLYEYGRERAKASPQWQELFGELKKKVRLENFKKVRSIFGNANLSWFYHPTFLSTPWQLQTRRCETAKKFARDAASPQTFKESICLRLTLQRDLPECAASGVTDFESWALLDYCCHGNDDQREQGFFAINWNFTNGQLKEEFGKWLREKRGDRKPVESERGKNKMRQYLKALGAKRLLDAGLTVEQAMKHTAQFSKDSTALYDSERGWSKAKNETVLAVLQRLFSPRS